MTDPGEPSVSVIMPSFNVGPYIAESIESALNQTHRNLEIIVVDDGSTDNTVDIVKGYGEKVRLIQQNNSGSAAARNLGAEAAQGKWLAFLDSDDIWAPGKLQRQLQHCGSLKWSHTDWYFIGTGQDSSVRASSRAPKYGGSVLSRLIVGNFVGTSTVLARRDAFLEVGGFDNSLMALQDWDLWLKMAQQFELSYLPEALVWYRVHDASTSRSPRKTKPYHLEIIDRIYSKNGFGASMQHLRRRTLAASYGVLSIIAEESNDHSFALMCALQSALHEPANWYRWKCVARTAIQLPKVLSARTEQRIHGE